MYHTVNILNKFVPYLHHTTANKILKKSPDSKHYGKTHTAKNR